MLKVAFSTVACPNWTLERVARAAAEYGYDGVELRTFDEGSAPLACDPALTDAQKVIDLFAAEGVAIAGVAASTRFDDVVDPPVIGHVLSDTERSVRAGKRAIGVAASIGAPLVRVFAFEGKPGEKRARLMARIVERLKKVADDARHSGVRVALENGGSFPKGSDLREIIDAVGSPQLGGCYSLAAAATAGESIEAGLDALASGDDLLAVRIKDLRGGAPCALGEGELRCAELVRSLARRGFAGWVVYEWDKMWLPEIAGAESVLPEAVKRVYEWAGESRAAKVERKPLARV